MSEPYHKERSKEVFDDGWVIIDGDGCVIAHLECSFPADCLLACLRGELGLTAVRAQPAEEEDDD